MGENGQLPAVAHRGEIIEQVVVKGDLANLKPEERAQLYVKVCESVGLNPMTQPFEYITLNGKLRLYARRDATDQLRRMHGVSIIEMTEKREGDLIVVTVQVRDAAGRLDMAKGAVSLKGLQGADLANAIMKAETKAKRRATLSICGLGFLDESEIEAPTKHKRLPKKNARDMYTRMQAEVDAFTDRPSLEIWREENKERLALMPEDWQDILLLFIQERLLDMARAEHEKPADASAITEAPRPTHGATTPDAESNPAAEGCGSSPAAGQEEGEETDSERLIRLEAEMKDAALRGTAALIETWKTFAPADQKVLQAAKDRVYKPAAAEVDRG